MQPSRPMTPPMGPPGLPPMGPPGMSPGLPPGLGPPGMGPPILPGMEDLLAIIRSGDPQAMAALAQLLQLEEQGEPPMPDGIGGGMGGQSPLSMMLQGGGMGGPHGMGPKGY